MTYQIAKELKDNIRQALLGYDQEIDLILVGLLAGGHVLIQGAPGIGKTSLAKILAASLDCNFKRIQFTPDMMPGDILGYSIYDQKESDFKFHKGAIFTNILLADEINRTTPRIQSALLEAMNEAQVSIDGNTYVLEAPFFVVATQNHYHSSGTYPLPDSQLDRFMLSFEMSNVPTDTYAQILQLHLSEGEPVKCVKPVITKQDILALQDDVKNVEVSEQVMSYIAKLAEATHNSSFSYGVSTRAGLSLMRSAQASAWLNERKYVYPDDVKWVMPYVFEHRLILRGKMRKAGNSVKEYLSEILETVAVP